VRGRRVPSRRSDGDDAAVAAAERHHRRFADDEAGFTFVDDRVGGTQIDPDIGLSVERSDEATLMRHRRAGQQTESYARYRTGEGGKREADHRKIVTVDALDEGRREALNP